jgi:hypothetical protein
MVDGIMQFHAPDGIERLNLVLPIDRNAHAPVAFNFSRKFALQEPTPILNP